MCTTKADILVEVHCAPPEQTLTLYIDNTLPAYWPGGPKGTKNQVLKPFGPPVTSVRANFAAHLD